MRGLIVKKSSKPLLMFVHRNHLTFFAEHWQQAIALALPDEIVKDLEYTKKDDVCVALKSFFSEQKIQPSAVVLILSEQVTFSKELEHTQESDAKSEEIKKFVHTVPFESKFSKELKIGKKTVLFCLNRNFYQPIVQCLHDLDFSVIAILPQLAVDEAIQVEDLSPELSHEIWGGLDALKKNANFIEEERTSVTDLQQPSHTREMLLVGVFVVLLLVLAGVYVWSTRPVAPAPQASPSLQPTPVVRVTPSPSPTVQLDTVPDASATAVASSAATTIIRAERIHILNGSGVSGQGLTLRRELEKLGYTNITTGTSPVSAGARSRMAVQPSLSLQQRQEILRVVQESIGSDVVVQEDSTISYQILIVTSQSE